MIESNVRLEVDQFLINNGWKEVDYDDDNFHYKKQIAKNMGIMIVNGQQIHQDPKMIDIEIVQFGIGYIDDECVYGYSVLIDNELIDTVYINTFEDFKKEIYEKI